MSARRGCRGGESAPKPITKNMQPEQSNLSRVGLQVPKLRGYAMLGKAIRPAALVIDDEPLVLIVAMDMIDELGFRAVAAPNADVAIQYLEQHDKIDLILSDINMPGSMDGVGLANVVKRRWPSIGVILSSGRPLEAATSFPKGADFIQKPYNLQTLSDHIRAVRH